MPSFTVTAVITGIICYVLGLVFGWILNKAGNSGKMKDAFKKGEESATETYRQEKEQIGDDLNEKLVQMRDTLISTVEAYEATVKSVDEKLSPGIGEQLSLTYNQDYKTKELGYQDLDKEKSSLEEKVEAEATSSEVNSSDRDTDIFDSEEPEAARSSFN